MVVMLGCHSTPLRSPPGVNVEADSQWLKDYTWAKSHQIDEADKSCATFTALSKDTRFPVREIALLRAVETCAVDKMPVLDRKALPPWLDDLAVDVLLKVASARADKAAELELALDKSKRKLPQAEKVKWTNLAIQRAEELGLKDRLGELKERLYQIAPRLNPEPLVKQYLIVAADFRMARQFDKSREFYQKVLHDPKSDLETKISALKGIRLSYKNGRNPEAHIAASQQLINFLAKAQKSDPKSRSLMVANYDAQIYLARAQWTMGNGAAAKGIFERLQKKLKGKVSLAELYWLQGRLAEENHEVESVSKYMDLALKEKLSEGDLRDKILWYSAWNERRRHEYKRSIEILSEIDQKTPTDFTRSRALYWLGRTYIDDKQLDEGKKVFERLIVQDPLGYYGLLAHRQLSLPIALSPQEPDADAPAEKLVPIDGIAAEWLNLLDEKDALTALLDIASQNYKKVSAQTDIGWVHIFKYYAKAGLYMKLYESLGTLTPERRKTIFEHHPELLFPQPWNEDVRGASLQFGVDQELIYAIIRQESAFDIHARSGADAFGLMQLLPEVAENLAKQNKIPYSTMEDLYEPKTNIYLGAAHLRDLFRRHKGQFILSVASYNASESVIQSWMKARFTGDPTEFIEDIPYEETRAYVRLVMRNVIFYSLLKSKSASIDFPTWILNLKAAG